MEDPGINSGVFYSRSCQSASTRKALANGVNVSTKLESASSSTDSTFKKDAILKICKKFIQTHPKKIILE